MKILQVTPKFFPSKGGVEKYVFELSRKLISLNHEVGILTSDLIDYYSILYIEKNFSFQDLEIKREKAFRLLPLPSHLGYFSLGMLMSLLQENNYDIIHSHSYGSFAITTSSIVKKMRKIRHVITTHSEPGRRKLTKILFDTLYSKFFLESDAIIALTKLEKEHLVKLGINKNKIHVIPNGVDVEFYSRNRKQKFEDLLNQDYVLFVGYFDISNKGVDILIRSFYLLRKSIKEIKLVIAAIPTRESAQLIDLIKKLRIEKDVKILLYLDDESIASLLKNCLFVILPSRTEAFGTVILEAFASGKTVIASKVGGIPEVINNGFNGLLFEPENTNDLLNKMLLLVKDDLLRAQLERNAYNSSFSYDWNLISRKINNLYQKILLN
ncbi:MAG: glycosyltransferase family 4 protein [Thermoproteota archaeon]|jgi:Glycosyltransferase